MKTPDHQLDLRSRHPNFQDYLDRNERESERIRETYTGHLNKSYGSEPLQTLDVFPSKVPNSPILIFIHGGYWKALDKKSYSFVAEPFVQNNITTFVVNYRLMPKVDLASVLQDITTSLNWIHQEASNYNGDATKLIISGHSAGGHLALMSYLLNKHLWSNIQGICSLSGIFDLDPIKNSYLNEVLQLEEAEVVSYSVTNKDLTAIQCPVLISVGSGETDFFIEQSKELYAEHIGKAPLEYYEYPELNHYEIVHELGKVESPLVNFILNCL